MSRDRLEDELKISSQKHSIDYQNVASSNSKLINENDEMKMRLYDAEVGLKKAKSEYDDLMTRFDYL